MKHNSSGDSKDASQQRARQKKIGDQLKKLYDDVAQEPVPDEFLKLLENADEANEDEGGNQA